MINRSNWKLTRSYLLYRSEIDQVSEKTIRLEVTWLRHLLEWAGENSFHKITRIKPSFSEYMLTARLDDEEQQLSYVYICKVISCAKHFLIWLEKNRIGFSNEISPAWLDTLRTPRMNIETKEHEAVTIEEILAISAAPVFSLRDERIRAAAVFLFLSGIRIGAFVTLPISAINLSESSIKQWPSLGVRTKFAKKATTFILDIPGLFEVVYLWDQKVRKHIPENGLWFAPLSPETGTFDPKIIEAGEHRQQRASKDLKDWLERVNLPYHSPHKFRHGHAVYALQNSKDVADLKAVSQNLMHSNLSITDGVYGILSTADVGRKIAGLGIKAKANNISKNDLVDQLIELANALKNIDYMSGTK